MDEPGLNLGIRVAPLVTGPERHGPLGPDATVVRMTVTVYQKNCLHALHQVEVTLRNRNVLVTYRSRT